jgi:hypothetical protein
MGLWGGGVKVVRLCCAVAMPGGGQAAPRGQFVSTTGRFLRIFRHILVKELAVIAG